MNTKVEVKERLSLSSGLIFKIHLARAYIEDCSVMLFDEPPMSLLKGKTGAAHKDYLLKMKTHKTIFIVTHQQEYIDMADIVVHLSSKTAPLVLYIK